MSTSVERSAQANKIQTKQVVKGFNAEKLKAPFLLRCGALLIDYITIICIPAFSILLGRFVGYDGAKLLNSEISNAGWLITILLAITNFIIFPLFSGQTFGKILTGLRVTNIDGTMPGFSSLLLRHLVGYPLTILTGGLGFLLSVFTSNGRALHDFLSGTTVVYGQKRLTEKNLIRKNTDDVVRKKSKKVIRKKKN